MTDYIKREDAMDAWYWNERYTDIESIPAADVVPMDFHERCLQEEIKQRLALERKHGKWIEMDEGHYICSACEGFVSCHYEYNFCPNCGADMRQKDGEDDV